METAANFIKLSCFIVQVQLRQNRFGCFRQMGGSNMAEWLLARWAKMLHGTNNKN